MSSQKYFHYYFSDSKYKDNFFVNQTNQKAFEFSNINNFDQNIFLFGSKKSGKTHLLNLWKIKNNALSLDNNYYEVLNSKCNIAIDDALTNVDEEKLFHIINHCKLINVKVYITSSIDLNEFDFIFKDLLSRLRTFFYLSINRPDDEMIKMYLTKLFIEKQIIIKNKDIFDYIYNRVDRTYLDVFNFVEKIDKLSLEKKRQLTIPLIREIL